MDVGCSRHGRAAEAAWRHAPLGQARLQDLTLPAL